MEGVKDEYNMVGVGIGQKRGLPHRDCLSGLILEIHTHTHTHTTPQLIP